MNDYTDILNMERPLSSHPKMDLGNRAKLFSSFDALRGFDLALLAKQVERQLTVRANLLDDAQELLDRKLHMVRPGARGNRFAGKGYCPLHCLYPLFGHHRTGGG